MTNKAEEFKIKNANEGEVQSRDTADGKKEFLDEQSGEWVSKTELKKRATARKKTEAANKKAEEKKAKEEAKRAAGGDEGGKKKAAADDEEIDPSKYTENRRNWL
jgi:lysyl-tRNA synthetase, class II